MRKSLCLGIAAAAAVLILSTADAASLQNRSFEADSDWTITIVDPNGRYIAYHSTGWASDGIRSFVFHRRSGTATAGSYAQISQESVDFTGVTKIVFDARDTGIDVVPLRFVLDDTHIIGTWANNGWPGGVGSGWGNTATTLNIEIPLETEYAGLHKFSVQMWNPASHYPADPKLYYIDNLTLVPEPSALTVLTGGVGALPLLWRRRRQGN